MTTDTNHRPEPGPSYWEFRCLRCGEHVIDHPRWWERLLARLTRTTKTTGHEA